MMQNDSIAILGEVLFDQLPDGQQVLGGAPFNVAWHLQAFKQAPFFISRIGHDALGEQICKAMHDWGMTTAGVQLDNEHPTGVVSVTLTDGEPSYQILDQQAYDFIEASLLDTDVNYAIIYHGTLALRHLAGCKALAQLKAQHTGKVFVDVNLRAPWWQAAAVDTWLNDANWLKLNEDELQQLTPYASSLTAMMQNLIKRYDLEVLVVTLGERGAVALTNTGELIETAPALGLPIADTVGAGDAFAAVLLLGLMHGWPLDTMMTRAQQFASALVTQQGATVNNLSFYQPFIDDWQLN